MSLQEQGDKPVLRPADPSVGIPMVGGFTAIPKGVKTSGRDFTAGIESTWSASTNTSLTLTFRYSLAGGEQWQVVPLASDATTTTVGSLIDGQLYDVAVAWKTAGGAVGEYSYIRNVAATAAPETPAPPTAMTVSDGGSGYAVITLTTSASDSYYKTLILRDGVQIGEVFNRPNASIAFNDNCGAGTFNWTARSVNVSNINSTSDAGPVNATIA